MHLRIRPSLRSERIETLWVNGTRKYLCYVYGEAILRGGKVATFRSSDAARKAGEDFLAYAAKLAD